MDNLEAAASLLQQCAFRPESQGSGNAAFLQACATLRRAMKAERYREEVRVMLADLVPALFLLTEREEVNGTQVHELILDLVSLFITRSDTRLLQLFLSCFSSASEPQSLHGLLYLAVGFESFPDSRKLYAAEKIAPTLLTLLKGESGKVREKAKELMELIHPHLPQEGLQTQATAPAGDVLLQWVTSAQHPQLPSHSSQKKGVSEHAEAALAALQSQDNFEMLLTCGFEVTASAKAKTANCQDSTVAALTDVTNTSKLMKVPSFSACQCVCIPHVDNHLEKVVHLRPESEDIDRLCRLLSYWTAKDSKKMITFMSGGTLVRTVINEYIHLVSVQNLCLFVFLFNSMLTHEAATFLLRELSHSVISSLSTVLNSIPRSREELSRVAGALSVITHIVHHISLSAKLVAIDEVVLEESKSATQSFAPLKKEVFATNVRELLGGILAVYTRDYWPVECESGGLNLRNEAGTLLNFILAKLPGELRTFHDSVLAGVAEWAVKLERVLQICMRNPPPVKSFALPSHTVERPVSAGLLEIIVTITRMLTSPMSQSFTPECWATIFHLVFIHKYHLYRTNGILLSSVMRLVPVLFTVPEDTMRLVLLGRGVMHKYIQAASEQNGTPDFLAVVRIFIVALQGYVHSSTSTLSQEIKKHSLWKQFTSKQKITSPTVLKRALSLATSRVPTTAAKSKPLVRKKTQQS